jgi:hypothetical protein
MVARNEGDLELDRAALLIAAEEYPYLDVEKYLDQIGGFADLARARDDSSASPLTRIMRLGSLLFDELGFRGAVLLRGQFIDVRSQTRFVASRRIAMQNALLNRLVNHRNGFRQQRPRLVEAARGESGAQLFNLSAQTGAVGGVASVAARILTIALLR